MISSGLFIGVGGSGRSTLHWLYDDIRRELIKNGWPWVERELTGNPMPRCWGFLAIDSDYMPVSSDPDVPEGGIGRVELVNSPISLTTIHQGVAAGQLGFSRLGWLPAARDLPNIDPADGLAQSRALGRMTAMYGMEKIVNKIRGAAAAIASPEAQSDLALVGQVFGTPTSAAAGDRRAWVVSSLSGGTGSGAWLDVAQYLASRPLNSADAWMRQSLTALLYLPELFENIDGANKGVAPNAMFALAELLNAYSDRTPRDPIDADLERLFTGAPHPSEWTAPQSTFFVGRRNAGVDFASPSEAYASTARMLGALLLDSATSASFKRVAVNMNSSNNVPLLKSSTVPASNVGFGRLDLGFEAFGEFVSRSLFQTTVARLLDPPGGERNEVLDRKQRVNRKADQVSRDFFRECGLHEEDEDATKNNQILYAIFMDDPERTASFFETRIKDTIKKIGGIKDVTDTQIKNAVSDTTNAATNKGRRGMFERTVKYGETVRANVITAVTTYSARYSVPVTIELLSRLDAQLAAASRQLTKELSDHDSSTQANLEKFVRSVLGKDAAKDALEHFKAVRRRMATEMAIAFIGYVRAGLVQPMHRDLSDWNEVAGATLAASDSLRKTVREWNGTDLPEDIAVPPTVVLIKELTELPERTAWLLSRSMSLPEEAARQQAVEEVVSGVWDGAPKASVDFGGDHRGFVEETSRFSLIGLCPDPVSDADADRNAVSQKLGTFVGGHAQVPAGRFRFTELGDLSVFTTQWTRTRTNVKDEVVTGFGTWLNRKHPDHLDRWALFKTKLDQAVLRAAPTVVYDITAYQRVHGSGDPKQAVRVSPAFPFSKQSQLGVAVESVFEDANLGKGGLPFDSTSDSPRIDLIRWFPDGLHPLTQSSVTQAIIQQLTAADNSFWELRQARPLSQTLPLTPAQMIAVARAWLAIVSLSLIDSERGVIWLGATETSIPTDAVTPGAAGVPTNAGSWLRVLLNSLLVRVARYTTDERSLQFYTELVRFGGYGDSNADDQEDLVSLSGVGSPAVNQAAVDVEVIRAWVSHGISVAKDRVPRPERAGEASASVKERAETLLSFLNGQLNAWDQLVADSRRDPSIYVARRVSVEHEMFPYFKTAAAQLISLVERVADGAGTGGPTLAGALED